MKHILYLWILFFSQRCICQEIYHIDRSKILGMVTSDEIPYNPPPANQLIQTNSRNNFTNSVPKFFDLTGYPPDRNTERIFNSIKNAIWSPENGAVLDKIKLISCNNKNIYSYFYNETNIIFYDISFFNQFSDIEYINVEYLILFSICHEIGHVLNGDLLNNEDRLGSEIRADNFACHTLCLMNKASAKEIESVILTLDGASYDVHYITKGDRLKNVKKFFIHETPCATIPIDNKKKDQLSTANYDLLLRDALGERKMHLSLPTIKNYIARNADPKATGLRNGIDIGWTALHECAMQNDIEYAIELLSRNVAVNAKNRNNATPLIIATCYKNWDVRALLLGIDSTELDTRTNRTNSSEIDFSKNHIKEISDARQLQVATVTNQLRSLLHLETKKLDNYTICAITNYLKIGADIHTKGDDGTTVLHFAAYINDTILMKKAIESNISINSVTDNSMLTPLMIAAENNSYNCARHLLYKYKSKHDLHDAFGQTALCHASGKTRTFQIIKDYSDSLYYISNNKKLENLRDHLGKFTFIKIAHRSNMVTEAALELFDYAYKNDVASLNKIEYNICNYKLLDQVSHHSISLFEFAVYNNLYDVVDFLIKKKGKIDPVIGRFTAHDLTVDLKMKKQLEAHGIFSFTKSDECY